MSYQEVKRICEMTDDEYAEHRRLMKAGLSCECGGALPCSAWLCEDDIYEGYDNGSTYLNR